MLLWISPNFSGSSSRKRCLKALGWCSIDVQLCLSLPKSVCYRISVILLDIYTYMVKNKPSLCVYTTSWMYTQSSVYICQNCMYCVRDPWMFLNIKNLALYNLIIQKCQTVWQPKISLKSLLQHGRVWSISLKKLPRTMRIHWMES